VLLFGLGDDLFQVGFYVCRDGHGLMLFEDVYHLRPHPLAHRFLAAGLPTAALLAVYQGREP
jgi:hypothetical protein